MRQQMCIRDRAVTEGSFQETAPSSLRRCSSLRGPLRLAADAAIHLSSKGRQDGWCRRHLWLRARAGFFAPFHSAQNDKIIVILRSAATKDLALARSPDRAITQGWRAESWNPKKRRAEVVAPYGGCGRAGRVPARDARAQTLRLSRQIPLPMGMATRRTSQVQSFTGTSPSAPDGAATSPQRGGRTGSADGVGRLRASAGFFAAGCAFRSE